MAPVSGLRRLTVREYDNVLKDLLLDPTNPSTGFLPDDQRHPFDNDYKAQDPSQALVQGLSLAAREAVNRLMADIPRRDMVVGCKPAGVTDAACFKSFITKFGRMALRHTLTPEQVTKFTTFSALGTEGADFYLGVRLALRAFLQHGSLVYRAERGTPVGNDPTLFKLQGIEMASRLSFFLWGAGPDNALLTSAEGGELDTAAGVRAAAGRMMKDTRAKDLVTRFHAQWLGYETLVSAGDLLIAQEAETSALMERVLFAERRPWRELFTFGETFVNDVLAKHYSLPLPGNTKGAWVVPTDVRRRGLLGQASFFAIGGSAFGDTSPTQRGKAVRNKLLCQVVPPPPPGVKNDALQNADPKACKDLRYAAHRAGGCAACHGLMDPIGFGLENFNAFGQPRATEKGNPMCKISGDGELLGVGTFNGPAELGKLMSDAGLLEPCLVQQLYRFAVGRTDLDTNDMTLVGSITDGLKDTKATLKIDDLMVDLVSSEPFRHRREEVLQ